mmetsp:Transcript_68607/g.221672  ORF Transcript_68607/g.221672 Transcript_68607/m.221672 type:complete len:242 (+) Transcript_68607:429-1154(+)
MRTLVQGPRRTRWWPPCRQPGASRPCSPPPRPKWRLPFLCSSRRLGIKRRKLARRCCCGAGQRAPQAGLCLCCRQSLRRWWNTMPPAGAARWLQASQPTDSCWTHCGRGSAAHPRRRSLPRPFGPGRWATSAWHGLVAHTRRRCATWPSRPTRHCAWAAHCARTSPLAARRRSWKWPSRRKPHQRQLLQPAQRPLQRAWRASVGRLWPPCCCHWPRWPAARPLPQSSRTRPCYAGRCWHWT